MQPLDLPSVERYVNENIGHFHSQRQNSLEALKLPRLLRKNPYLLKAKNVVTAGQLIEGLLEAYLSSSEEEFFGRFLEGLAIFVAQQTSSGHKSSAEGVDLEFFKNSVHYVMSIKSGPNWGNATQHNGLEQNLKLAVSRLRQSPHSGDIRSVLGICYGKTRTAHMKRGYLKVVGQNFWYLISEDKNLYQDIIEPIGHRAREHNEQYLLTKVKATNRLTKQFFDEYCLEDGSVNWPKLVETTCGNYDLDKFLPNCCPTPRQR